MTITLRIYPHPRPGQTFGSFVLSAPSPDKELVEMDPGELHYVRLVLIHEFYLVEPRTITADAVAEDYRAVRAELKRRDVWA